MSSNPAQDYVGLRIQTIKTSGSAPPSASKIKKFSQDPENGTNLKHKWSRTDIIGWKNVAYAAQDRLHQSFLTNPRRNRDFFETLLLDCDISLFAKLSY